MLYVLSEVETDRKGGLPWHYGKNIIREKTVHSMKSIISTSTSIILKNLELQKYRK